MRALYTVFVWPLILLSIGCQPGELTTLDRSAAPPQVQAAWALHEGNQYSFSAPSTYVPPKNVMAGSAEVQNLGNAASSYGLLPPNEAPTSSADLVLYDKNYKPVIGEPPTGLILSVSERKKGANLEKELADAAKKFTEEEKVKIDFPVGPGYEIRAGMKLIGGEKVWVIIYILCDGMRVYNFRFETTNGAAAIDPLAREIVETFRVK